ncbi:MAG: hypothetical protein KAR22_12075 [Gammaproteobacteria bacterium]|nr:hypothetical protein [Gammaproteobacteria bacterium]
MLDRLRPHLDRNALCLLLCGLAALYWELVLIRWLGTSVRIVAYYSNFVLMAAFFGLGAGALLARYDVQLRRLIFPAITPRSTPFCVNGAHSTICPIET